jgi:hypothetical protein
MKEPLLSAVVPNEAEPSVSNESLDRAAWHSRLLGHIGAAGDKYQYSFHLNTPEAAGNIEEAAADPFSGAENGYACVGRYFTFTVITEQAPGSVLWRSSPS